MAELLGTVLINANFSSFTSGDVIKSFYDPATDLISVTKNDVTITSGEVLLAKRTGLPSIGDYWARVNTGYTLVVANYDGSTDNVTLSFSETSGFPYFIKAVTITPDAPVEGEINNISIALVSITNTTNTTTKDGEIVVVASGVNTPFKYSFNRPEIVNGQSTGTFSNLPRGSYTIFAVDSLGYSARLIISVSADGETHGVKWRTGFQDDVGQAGRIDILERGFVGSLVEVKGNSTPFTHSTRGEARDIVDISIVSSQVDVSLIAEALDQYISIANADDDKYKLIIYKDVASSWVETWRGFINPESFSDTPNGTPYPTNFTATDRVADLSSREFLYNEEYIKGGENEFVVGDMSQLGAIKICLDKTKLDQGYRIACNIFDANHDVVTPATLTPLVQTFINTDVYSGDDKVSTCETVLKDILIIYDAMLVSWAGYWYIIRKKELLGTTVNYIEFDKDLTYVATSSWNPRVDFKGAIESNRYRWVGGMSRIMSSVFRKVILTIKTVVNDSGLISGFQDFTLVQVGAIIVTGRDGNTTTSITSIDSGESLDIQYTNKGLSESFLIWNDNITYSTNDKLIIDLSFNFNAFVTGVSRGSTFTQKPPYLILRWSLKLGDEYLTTKGEWQSEDPLNQFFVTSFNEDVDFRQEIDLPDGNAATDAATLKIFPINFYDADIISSFSTFEQELIDVETVNLDLGARRVIYYNDKTGYPNGDFLVYYKLSRAGVINTENDSVTPSDYDAVTNDHKWEWITEHYTVAVQDRTVGASSRPVYSNTSFKSINLNFLPNSEEIPEEVITYNTNDILNKVDYNKEINLFDLTNSFNNDAKIFLNYNKLSNGDPTSVWNESGSTLTKTLQDHLVDWLQRLTKKARMIISGTFFTDVEFTPINVLNDPSDSNRVFYPNGISSDVKRRQYNGEVIEIGSDNVPESSQYDLSVTQDQHR